jgi:hypothetical protein
MAMNDFVKVFHNVVSDNDCEYITKSFDNTIHLSEIRQTSVHNFRELHIEQYEEFNKVKDVLIGCMTEKVKLYKTQFKDFCFPKTLKFEPIKIKKYEPGGIFDWHVDVTSHNSMSRYLAFFIYLTDNEEGKTRFLNKSVDCKKGSMVIFPPMWPWVHKGEAPIDTPKYIVGSYLHYNSPAWGAPNYMWSEYGDKKRSAWGEPTVNME